MLEQSILESAGYGVSVAASAEEGLQKARGGGHALFLSSRDIQLGRGEPIADTARVLSRYVDGIMIRTFAHQEVEDLARFAAVPVINGLTDLSHPCQVMADLFTLVEAFGTWDGKRIAWIGDGNNMANSWLEAAAVAVMGLVLGGLLGAVNLYFLLDVVRRDTIGLQLNYEFPFGTMLTMIPAMLGAGFIAALWPSEAAVRGSLVEALEYE